MRLESETHKAAEMSVHCYSMARAPNYEDRSLYFPFKLVLLSIFYSLSSYQSTNVILLLDFFSHVAKMLSPLMLRLEMQNMKISHYILSSNLHY